MPRPIFQNLAFLFHLIHLKNLHSRDVNSKFQFKRSSILDVQSKLTICSYLILLCKHSYGYHNQASFHKYLPNGTLFSCEICQSLWKIWAFLSPKAEKNVKRYGWDPFNQKITAQTFFSFLNSSLWLLKESSILNFDNACSVCFLRKV